MHYLFYRIKRFGSGCLRAVPARLWAFAAMLVGLVLPLLIMTSSASIVHVSDSDGFSRLLITSEIKPAALMAKAGVQADQGDRVYYTAFNGDFGALTIQRAFEVTVCADGKSLPVRMTEGSVKDALQQAGVAMGEHDYTVPGLAAELSDGDTITVHRVVYSDIVETQAIPYETEYVETSLFYRSQNKTVTQQKGIDGELSITTRERWVDGELESTRIIDVTQTRQPQTEIIKVYGAKAPVSSLTGPDGTTNKPEQYSRVITGRATGYSSRGGQGASGLGLGYGTVAVDPSVIPYGTLLYIESTDGQFVYGYAVATDTGTAMREGHALVDLYYETYKESVANGVIRVNIYVVE